MLFPEEAGAPIVWYRVEAVPTGLFSIVRAPWQIPEDIGQAVPAGQAKGASFVPVPAPGNGQCRSGNRALWQW